MPESPTQSAPRPWSPRSIAILVLVWLILQLGGIFSPGLLDDVDSIYIQIAREMLRRHDYVTPYIDGIRFFDKPPLMYWMAAASMRLFGIHDWAARLPLALAVFALLLAVYALGIRLFRATSPAAPDRAGFYAALALATAIGPYLYTRFYIPDILLALWMTLAVHLFLIALDRIALPQSRLPDGEIRVPHLRRGLIADKVGNRASDPLSSPNPSLLPCLAFAAVLALNVLTKGLIGLVFPIAFVLLYLALTRQLHLLPRFHPLASTAVFLALAAPWHILAALRNPAIPLPPGLGLPATGGWAWFYLYNEHFARFLGKRIPHDYGLTPIWLFWLYLAIWIIPWTTFLPSAIAHHIRTLRHISTGARNRVPHLHRALAVKVGHRAGDPLSSTTRQTPNNQSTADAPPSTLLNPDRDHEAALALILWFLLVMVFFSISSRQEYYSLPAIPALALMAGALLARADQAHLSSTQGKEHVVSTRSEVEWASPLRRSGETPVSPPPAAQISALAAAHSALRWHLFLLAPLTTAIALVCAWFALTAPHPAPGTDLSTLLANSDVYNLSLSHLFDLTGAAMGLFRGPLAATALGMLVLGLGSFVLRRKTHTYAANLTMAAAMTLILLAAHEGLTRFYPILGSKGLSLAILQAQQTHPRPNDLILLDGELTSGSTLIFYTGQPVHLINGRVNGPWYGSFWPDSPRIFENESTLRQLWASPRRIFLLTYNPAARTRDLAPSNPVHTLASAGGKTILTNH